MRLYCCVVGAVDRCSPAGVSSSGVPALFLVVSSRRRKGHYHHQCKVSFPSSHNNAVTWTQTLWTVREECMHEFTAIN